MKIASGCEIELEKGEALKRFEDLTPEEIKAMSDRNLAKVTALAEQFDLEVVTREMVNRKKREQNIK